METYIIKKTKTDNLSIDSKEWETANVACISYAAPNSTYSPVTTAKILHSESGLSIKTETDEKPLRAAQTERDSEVCLDSCIELFIAPKGEKAYLNFEINPLGVLHLGLGESRYDRVHPEISTEAFDIESKIGGGKWQMKFFIPFSFINSVFGTHSSEFVGNMYKCGEETGREHYLTWSKVELPQADFHRPEFFGNFILEQH